MQWYRFLLPILSCVVCAAQDRRPIGSYEDGPQRPAQGTKRATARSEDQRDGFSFSTRSDRIILHDCEEAAASIRCTYTYINETRLIRTVRAPTLYRNLALLDDEQHQYPLQGAFFVDPANRSVQSVTLKPGEEAALIQEYGAASLRPRQVQVYSNYPRHESPSVPVRAGNAIRPN